MHVDGCMYINVFMPKAAFTMDLTETKDPWIVILTSILTFKFRLRKDSQWLMICETEKLLKINLIYIYI